MMSNKGIHHISLRDDVIFVIFSNFWQALFQDDIIFIAVVLVSLKNVCIYQGSSVISIYYLGLFEFYEGSKMTHMPDLA